MTVLETQLLAAARAELGTYEQPPGTNLTKYGAWFGWNGVAWCAIFVSYLCAKVGIRWRFASTVAAMHAAQRAGLWSTTPRVGWACMRRHTATTGHIGVVEAVHRDGTVTSIEGNTNAAGSREGDGAYRKRRSATWWTGYINLPALAEARPGPAPVPTPPPPDRFKERVMAKPVLRRGAQGHDVKVLQALMIAHHAWPEGGKVDGDFGPATEAALKSWQRATRSLDPDGVCGPATWAWLVGV